jgi:hypothetical protein
VTWTDNSNNENGFTLSNGVTSVNLAANTTSYSWGGLSSGTYMCFHVLAYNSAGNSAWTPYACTTTSSIPAAPSKFHLTVTRPDHFRPVNESFLFTGTHRRKRI